jgi:hypothetical protein
MAAKLFAEIQRIQTGWEIAPAPVVSRASL